MKGINQELGKTTSVVTNDPQTAAYADRTFRLDKGRFVTDGRPESVGETTT